MWGFIGQSGPATAVLDFTQDFSLAIAGLPSLVALSAGMIAFAAIRHHLAQKTQPAVGTSPPSTDHQEAA